MRARVCVIGEMYVLVLDCSSIQQDRENVEKGRDEQRQSVVCSMFNAGVSILTSQPSPSVISMFGQICAVCSFSHSKFSFFFICLIFIFRSDTFGFIIIITVVFLLVSLQFLLLLTLFSTHTIYDSFMRLA